MFSVFSFFLFRVFLFFLFVVCRIFTSLPLFVRHIAGYHL